MYVVLKILCDFSTGQMLKRKERKDTSHPPPPSKGISRCQIQMENIQYQFAVTFSSLFGKEEGKT